MKTLNILIFLLIFNTFILLGYLTSTLTGNVVHDRIFANVTRVIDEDTFDSEIGKARMLGKAISVLSFIPRTYGLRTATAETSLGGNCLKSSDFLNYLGI